MSPTLPIETPSPSELVSNCRVLMALIHNLAKVDSTPEQRKSLRECTKGRRCALQMLHKKVGFVSPAELDILIAETIHSGLLHEWRELFEKCGADMEDPKVRAVLNKCTRRGLVTDEAVPEVRRVNHLHVTARRAAFKLIELRV